METERCTYCGESCGAYWRRVNGLLACNTCRQYLRKHGTPRPQWLIERAKRRKDSVKMCSECGAGEPREKSWRYNEGRRVCRPCRRRYLREERRLAGHPQSQESTPGSTSSERTGSLNKTYEEITGKKSSIQKPSLSTRCGTGYKVATHVHKMKRTLGVFMKDKSKKYLVTRKPKASHLHSQGQHILKDHTNKYQSVDRRGVVMEGMSEDEHRISSSMLRSLSSDTNESGLFHHDHNKAGTDSEPVQECRQKQCEGKISASSAPSLVLSSGSVFIAGSSSSVPAKEFLDITSSSGIVASQNSSSTSTSRNRDTAVLFHESNQISSTSNVESSKNIQLNETSGDSPPAINGRDMKCVLHCSSESPPVNSPVTQESLPSQSRVDLRPPANATNSSCLLTVKEEPTESPTPDRLPSPPQIDQTDSRPTSSAEGNSGGEKERQELWSLGVAELKKGHEIDSATLKVENLQKALSEATSDLQRMKSEMKEILRRKSELLGIPIPNIFK
ncbi:hypothetical protein KIN20_002435 [Parelaphostrongylus tenuis]|uniref:GATA-type domain-containing protein n=1 Tax=Parelaphostrongylus tenuis TaxID=148309 RepID=A0AAD5QGR7_PARTN|nr:hypothetical protein KIN20_002435 [Parelaphostrongylus tenuis]